MKPYQYVILRCVPRVDREEFLNVGVVLHCEDNAFLDAACHVDEARLGAFGTDLDLKALREGLTFVASVCRGEAAAGDVATKTASVRFGFLKAPRSTVVQPGPVHGGMTNDPAAELARLLDRLVRV